jgi:hypothetical protein
MKFRMGSMKLLISLMLMAILVAGFTCTAFADDTDDGDAYLKEYVIPADEVDEDKWNSAVVYGQDGIETLTVQKDIDWIIPVGNFARSNVFLKTKGSTIGISVYLDSDGYHHVGIRRPDGSMSYVNGKHQVTHTFTCNSYGYYYVYIENMGSTEFGASGYYVR